MLPVYCRITMHQVRADFSINTWISEKNWEAGKYNFGAIQAKIQNLYDQLSMAGEVTAMQLREAFKGAKPKYLLKVFESHLKDIKQLDQQYTISTYNCYKRAYELLRMFIQRDYHCQDLPLVRVNHTFITKFDFYLKTSLRLANNTVVKYLARLKKVIRLAIAHGWIDDDPFALFKIRFDLADKQWLDDQELKRISKKKFTIPRLDKVKDVFLFCCYTGLSYSDVAKLTRQHTVIIAGEKWIVVNRTKTNVPSRIPLLPQAEKILTKYRDQQEKLLPVMSNQKMNAYLKEIADLCRISKNLTVHVARHTFATTVTLSKGVSMESISKMLGHRSTKVTSHYARIVDEKLAYEMRKLKNKTQ